MCNVVPLALLKKTSHACFQDKLLSSPLQLHMVQKSTRLATKATAVEAQSSKHAPADSFGDELVFAQKDCLSVYKFISDCLDMINA